MTIWRPKKVSRADFLAAEALQREYAPLDKGTLSLIRRRDRFMEMNGFRRFGKAIIPLTGQMWRAGLKPSSILTYLRVMLRGTKKDSKALRLMKAVAKAAARCVKKKARRLRLREAHNLMFQLEKLSLTGERKVML